jgi:hypothetical protein
MFTFNERDLHRMPTPAKTHLPVKKFIAESNILDEESGLGEGSSQAWSRQSKQSYIGLT